MTSLSTVNAGTFRCVRIQGNNEAQVRLKRIGVCEGRDVEVVQAGDPMILRAVGARIGISRAMAANVQVDLPEGNPEHSHG